MTQCQSSPEWICLEVIASPELVDAVSDLCIEHDSGGVVLDDDDPEAVRIIAYFPVERWEGVRCDLEALQHDLRSLFPAIPVLSFTTSTLMHENWAVSWKDNFRSMEIGTRLVVTPPWIVPEHHGRQTIVIEPGEAFGTGTHETTQGCLELLEEAVEDIARTGEEFSLLDVGCGSGILAIAGVKLGAGRVVGVDNDPAAIENARKNLAVNGVEEQISLVCTSFEEITEPADIVTANLDTRTLLSSREHLMRLHTRFLIISGVPLNEWDRVKATLQTGRSRLRKEITRSEWGCGLFSY